MFIRKKKNKSGSTSIQIIEKKNGINKIIKTIGSAFEIKEIEKLYRQALYELPRIYGPTLFDIQEEPKISELNNDNIHVIGPDEVFEVIYNKIGFVQIKEKLLKYLVISRLTHAGSKLKLSEYLRETGKADISVYSIYRFLDKFSRSYKSEVENISFNYTKKLLGGNIGVVFYDITTIYFESSQPDDFRITGFSKEGKHQHPQILLGLLIGKNAYPIGYEIFEGNTFEGHTLIPVLEHFIDRFDLEKPIVVADAGLLTKNNIEALRKNGYKFILGARIKNETSEIIRQIEKLKLDSNQIALIKKEDNIKLYISYSPKRASKDKFTRERGLKRLEKNLSAGRLTKSNINNRGYNKYLLIDGDIKIKIDYDKFNNDKKWDGLKGYITNTDISGKEVIEQYNNLWKIERAFRISKTDLRIRPIYHRLKSRIEAHICISFVSYLLYKELERVLIKHKSFLSVEKAIEQINKIYAVVIKNEGGVSHIFKLKNNSSQQELLDIISVEF